MLIDERRSVVYLAVGERRHLTIIDRGRSSLIENQYRVQTELDLA